MVAVLYCRVSTEDQNLGPDAQRGAMEAWCASHGVRIAATCEDHGVSGGASLEKRPGLLASLDALKAHRAGILLVAKRDRLARDPIIAAMTEAAAARVGAKIVSAAGEGCEGDDPASVLMRRMVDAFAEYERGIIRARTKAALAIKARRGERVSRIAPIGTQIAADGRTLDADSNEQRAIARVRALHAAGESYRAIARTLNAEGVACRGSRWHATTIMRIIARNTEA